MCVCVDGVRARDDIGFSLGNLLKCFEVYENSGGI